MKFGLDRIRRVLERLGNPERRYPSALIAGTNGKGSTARMVDSVLREAGNKTGLYTSPHLERFNERILIGGREVSDESLEAVLQDFQRESLPIEDLTWFEKATLLAFEIFRREKIDIAVLEVGLGGRLDATNVVDPPVSAITSISRDHVEVLGNSLFDIAREKAGVMRLGRPIVLGPMKTELRDFLQKACRMGGAEPVTPSAPLGTPEDFEYDCFAHLQLGLEGAHQLRNAAVAVEILKALRAQGIAWNEEHLRRGFRQVRNPGRLEWVEGAPPILLDGAHNEESLAATVDYLGKKFPQTGPTLVLGMMADKDSRAAVQILKQLQPKWVLTEVSSPRSLKMFEWRRICEQEKIDGDILASPEAALSRARELTSADRPIVVTGSLYLVGEIRRRLGASGAIPEAS